MNLRAIRRTKNLSLPQLAKMTGFSKGYLSKIERSNNLPPVSTLQGIAYALGMELMELLDKQRPNDICANRKKRNIDIVRSGKMQEKDLSETTGGYQYASLLHCHSNHQMSPFLMLVEKGKTETFSHDSEEFGHILEGSVVLSYDGEKYELNKGDSFYIDSRIEHSYVNNHNAIVKILAVNYNYRRF